MRVKSAIHDYLVVNQVSRAHLELASAALTQQQVELEEERAKATQREVLPHGQIKRETIRET